MIVFNPLHILLQYLLTNKMKIQEAFCPDVSLYIVIVIV